MVQCGRWYGQFGWKNIFRVWLAYCLVYSVMLFWFWWGNHDWRYLKDGIKLSDGFFEARYSVHFLTTILLEGQILPVLSYVLALLALSVQGGIVAKYLEVPEKNPKHFLFLLLIGVSPYVFILFYYVFLAFSLCFWGTVAVALLFFSEKPYRKMKFVVGVVGYILILGSYPPILAMLAVLFVGRRIFMYQASRQTLREVFFNGILFLLQLGCSLVCYRLFFIFLKQKGYLNPQMYNIQISSFTDVFGKILTEIVNSVNSIFFLYQSFGGQYSLFYGIVFLPVVVWIFGVVRNKFVALIMICGLLLASRISFVIAENAHSASFRVGYWGIYGVVCFSLAVLLKMKNRCVCNCVFVGSIIFAFLFVRTDYEIQKVLGLGFKTERLYQKRLEERLFFHPEFDIDRQYVTLNLGYPDFRRRFCADGFCFFNNDLLASTVLPADLGEVLFWDDVRTPVAAKFGVWGKRLWLVSDTRLEGVFSSLKEEQVRLLRFWMYMEAKSYPNESGIYVNEEILVLNLEEAVFNQDREVFLVNVLSF